MWATMTGNGSQIGNIALKRIFDRKSPKNLHPLLLIYKQEAH